MVLLRNRRVALGTGAVALAVMLVGAPAAPRAQHRGTVIVPASIQELRAYDALTQSMLHDGELRVRATRDDALVAGHTIERADQYYKGVRVFGADVARQFNGGSLVSVFGVLYPDVDIDTNPAMTSDEARAKVVALAGLEQGADRQPELTILPFDAGGYRLAWRMQAFTSDQDLTQYFVDAKNGDVVLQYSNRQTQASSVGREIGVLGDNKKISVSRSGGAYRATDVLRPPVITTFDMKGDAARLDQIFSGQTPLTAADIASDDDNNWTDGAVGDAHVYAGYTYDYYFKRFGRRGLDNNDTGLYAIVHPVARADFSTLYKKYPNYYLNAQYLGSGWMLYGEGLPAGLTSGGQTYDYWSGSLDIVAHELTHGVTEYSSALIYRNESGALNESFSDVMGASVEFFFQPAGNGPLKADYLLGEDTIRPGGTRSLADPGAYGDPDHYSKRYLGKSDNGGVHTNSGISNNAFYLAIEGGTNKTSGLGVQGVGATNREQIEKVFYRAFTQLLPSNATFSMARAATIQAARDLYGSNSAAERAVTQAWTAVGVN